MKLVREHIEFIRGESPFKALNIGKRAQIENWFETWVSDVDYEIDDDLNIRVKNSLWLQGIKINYLPDNLHIEGFLDIERAKIIFLPDNLHVEGYLDLRDTNITSLPDDLYVKGGILKDF